MNDDLISRSALIKEFEDTGLGDDSLIESVFAAGVYTKIENAPSVKAAPVKNAKWRIGKKEIICAGNDGCYEAMRWSSSIQVGYFNGKLPGYCPHCGAKMDKEATNDEP